MADPTSSNLTSTKTKTAVICPGESVVLKRRINILNTILENGAQASTPCENFLINQSIQDRKNYGFYFEWVKEQQANDYFAGISINGTDYDFGGYNKFAPTYQVITGLDDLYNQIINTVPNGSVLFQLVNKDFDFYAGPATDSSRDDMYRLMLTVGSFSSIMGSNLESVYLYGLGAPQSSSTFPGMPSGDILKFRIYPIELT